MDIILSTINARYSHTSFGLRYLYANLPANLQSMAEIVEFNLGEAIDVIAEKLLNKSPKIIGLGVYIWNIAEVTELVGIIKSVSPATKVIVITSYSIHYTKLYETRERPKRARSGPSTSTEARMVLTRS